MTERAYCPGTHGRSRPCHAPGGACTGTLRIGLHGGPVRVAAFHPAGVRQHGIHGTAQRTGTSTCVDAKPCPPQPCTSAPMQPDRSPARSPARIMGAVMDSRPRNHAPSPRLRRATAPSRTRVTSRSRPSCDAPATSRQRFAEAAAEAEAKAEAEEEDASARPSSPVVTYRALWYGPVALVPRNHVHGPISQAFATAHVPSSEFSTRV